MGNRYICLLIVAMFVLVMPTIVAQPVFEKGTDVVLSVPCTIAGATCGVGATCDATILDP